MPSKDRHPSRPPFLRAAATTAATLLLVYAIGSDAMASAVGERGGTVLADLRSDQLNRGDAQQLTRGYYEHLTGVNRFNSRLWEVYAGAESVEDRRPLRDTDLVVLTGDFQYLELKPSLDATYRGKPFRTNQWGMRDRPYPRTPTAGTRRVALLGQSYVMGGGVADDSTFEAIAERALPAETGQPWEILNFGSGNYMPARQLVQLERSVLGFAPDIVVSVGHQLDLSRIPANIADALFAKADIPIPFAAELVERLGIGPSTPHEEAMRRLAPHRETLYAQIQRAFVAACRSHGARPIFVLIPTPDAGAREADVQFMLDASRAAGFEVYDLYDVYRAHADAAELQVASWDTHPNEQGHRIIADRFIDVLTTVARTAPPAPLPDRP